MGSEMCIRDRPGTYQAVLRIENTKQEHHFEILKDPRLETSEEDYQAQFDLWMNIRDQLSETNRLLNQLRRIRREIHVILERPTFKRVRFQMNLVHLRTMRKK